MTPFYLTNQTCDLLHDPDTIRHLLDSLDLPYHICPKNGFYPLTEKEQTYIGDDEVPVGHAGALTGQTALYEGKKYLAPTFEFHFRNDATRHLWGTPVTYETDLPDRDTVREHMEREVATLREKLEPLGGHVFVLDPKEYMETDDRFPVEVLIPFDAVSSLEDYDAYTAWLASLVQTDGQ